MILLGPEDRSWLVARGMDPGRVERQLGRLARGRMVQRLVRPARLGDGIRPLGGEDRETAWARAVRAGRLGSFIPASGAATRLFRALLATSELPLEELSPEDPDHREVLDLLGGAGDLAAVVGAGVDPADRPAVRRRLLALAGEGRPKLLLPFHLDRGRVRTPLHEHLLEAVHLLVDAGGRARVHFTVPPAWEEAIRAEAARIADELGREHGVEIEVRTSTQHPATDTPCLDEEGRPVRDDAGRLLLRPGGHGALLRNLDALGGDIVVIRNVDNVVHPDHLAPNLAVRRRLVGELVLLEEQVHGAVNALRAGGGLEEGARALAALGLEAPVAGDEPERRAAMLDRLDRPLRVCGMVRNQGDVGGGPFWVEGPEGVTLQVVELAQVDRGDPEQARLVAAATHFNPVEIAASVRDAEGRPYPLADFADADAGILTRKSWRGRPIRALELPGLWNGGMAGWNTVFVEVPLSLYNPVKRLFDLLAPLHRPAR